MKTLLITTFLLFSSLVQAAAYIKIGDIKGESEAHQKAKMGYETLAKKSKKIEVARGQEGTLPPGLYLHPNGKMLKVTAEGHKEWIDLLSASASTNNMGATKPRDAASGLPTGKRQHKPVTIAKENCVNGTVKKGKYKGKKCEHRGHVTVLK